MRSKFNKELGQVLLGDGLMNAQTGDLLDPSAMTDAAFDKIAADVYAAMVEKGELPAVEALPSQDNPGDDDNLPKPKADGSESDLDKILSAIADPSKVVDLDAVNEARHQEGKADVFAEIGQQMQAEHNAADAASATAA